MASIDSGTAAVRRLGRLTLDFSLPPRCLACGALIDAPMGLCGPCWSGLTFLDGSMCARCGFPFPYEEEQATLCGTCSAEPPAYGRARSALAYDEASRPLILAFKHGDRLHGARLFATWLARAGAELLGGADLLVPVPLHWTRLFARRYNQSAVLALALGRAAGVAVAPDLLQRRRRTPSQGGLGRSARRRNVRGAFGLRPQAGLQVRGARVVLVDDVMTTGATVEACARVLLRAGAAHVDVLCLARVVREGHLA